MFCRVPYVDIQGRHRPYLEILFSNAETGLVSNKTLAMIDSGADHTIIPYSIGNLIGFEKPLEGEQLLVVNGVGGGSLKYVERACKIHLANNATGKIYVFNETVWWIFPDDELTTQLTQLIEQHSNLEKIKSQTLEDTELRAHFEGEQLKILNQIIKIQSTLEPGTLLGRPFFDNFEFITFIHRDRNQEEKAYFNYKVHAKKPEMVTDFDGALIIR